MPPPKAYLGHTAEQRIELQEVIVNHSEQIDVDSIWYRYYDAGIWAGV